MECDLVPAAPNSHSPAPNQTTSSAILTLPNAIARSSSQHTNSHGHEYTTMRALWAVGALLHLIVGACLFINLCEALLLADDLSRLCLLAGMWAAVAAFVLAVLCGSETVAAPSNATGELKRPHTTLLILSLSVIVCAFGISIELEHTFLKNRYIPMRLIMLLWGSHVVRLALCSLEAALCLAQLGALFCYYCCLSSNPANSSSWQWEPGHVIRDSAFSPTFTREGQDSVSVEVGPDGYRINYINMQAPPEYNLQAESNKQQDTEPEQNYTLNK